jgi:RNA recognition motif-containing protein
MGTRLFVGNLSFNVTEDQLRTLFEEGGRQVERINIVVDRDTGRPRGFGFVDMGSEADAQAAIQALNGKELAGRPITVNEARERPPRTGGFGGGGEHRGGGGRRRGY